MKISEAGEFGLIEKIKRSGAVRDRDVVIGIGDDAAVIKRPSKKYALMTTDTLVEKVHFNLKYFTFYELGWKLLAVNISDIAAMGGIPRHATITLGLNDSASVENIDDLYRGIKALAKKHKISIVGGDIVSSPKSLFFTIDLYGEANKIVPRSGARPGDVIVSIGKLGGSSVGLRYLKKSGRKALKLMRAQAMDHLMPHPMVKEGSEASKYATSMIDNSDGLARCLIEICKASNVGARINLKNIPLANGASLKDAFEGGEDYNLILTVPKSRANSVKKGIIIGEITRNKKIILINGVGQETEMDESGFKHF
jgi:thiamine-monophosphate kinase